MPDVWISRIFDRMEDRYGDLWASRYGAFPRARVMRSWAEDLSDMTPAEIIDGMTACRDLKFPPTLPEFRMLCRPDRADDLFSRAVRVVSLPVDQRDYGGDSVLYWSIQRFGEHDIKVSTTAGGPRWRQVVSATADEWRRGLLPVIPERREALPAPGHTSVTREEAEKRVKSLGLALSPIGDRAWAQKILDRAAKGEMTVLLADKWAAETVCAAD